MYSTLIMPTKSDPELPGLRHPKILKLVIPSRGIGDETGLCFMLGDYWDDVDGGYGANKDKEIMADKLNCVILSMDYLTMRAPLQVKLLPSFPHNLRAIYGIDIDPELSRGEVGLENLNQIKGLGTDLRMLDSRCVIDLVVPPGEYQTWGFLDAIDGINAVGMLIHKFALDSSRIFLCGCRYGGYVAQLMVKFAPDTFAAIVDVGGYCRAEMRHIVGLETMDPDVELVYADEAQRESFVVRGIFRNKWTALDETSPFYFSDAHRLIRSLHWEPHCTVSDTQSLIFHAKNDPVVEFKEKEKMVSLLRKYRPINFYDIALKESLTPGVDLWCEAISQCTDSPKRSTAPNDFIQGSKRSFATGDKAYLFSYAATGVLEVKVAWQTK